MGHQPQKDKGYRDSSVQGEPWSQQYPTYFIRVSCQIFLSFPKCTLHPSPCKVISGLISGRLHGTSLRWHMWLSVVCRFFPAPSETHQGVVLSNARGCCRFPFAPYPCKVNDFRVVGVICDRLRGTSSRWHMWPSVPYS